MTWILLIIAAFIILYVIQLIVDSMAAKKRYGRWYTIEEINQQLDSIEDDLTKS